MSNDTQPAWYKSLVNWMFTGLGSTVGVILLGLFWHETRLTRLEADRENTAEVLREIKDEVKTVGQTLIEFRREFDRQAK